MIQAILFGFGLLWVVARLLDLYDMVRAMTSRGKLAKFKGSWAVVTASTEGIGHGFTVELCKRGLNIIQVARSPENMQSVSTTLQAIYGNQFINIPFNFEQSIRDPIASYVGLYEKVKHFDISIVVNNIGYASYGFLENEAGVLLQNNLNIWPCVMITRLLLPNIIKRGAGGIVNLSSFAGIKELAFVGNEIYSAGKAFVSVFSEVLASELPSGISAICIAPCWVDTPSSRTVPDEYKKFVIDKYQCAQAALSQLFTVNFSFGHYYHLLAYFYYELDYYKSLILRS